MKLQSLRDLFVDELKDVYDAENRLVKALPKMAKSASSPQLRDAFTDHLEKTRSHLERLEQIFSSMGEQAKAKPCDGMKGLVEEGKSLIEEKPDSQVLDAGLIAAAQRVEHYEMAAYGSLKAWAEELGESEAVELLEETLREEKEADETLSRIAESGVNSEAAQGSGASGSRSAAPARAAGRKPGAARSTAKSSIKKGRARGVPAKRR
jgi:ferritin-like metal-binding protein YciE